MNERQNIHIVYSSLYSNTSAVGNKGGLGDVIKKWQCILLYFKLCFLYIYYYYIGKKGNVLMNSILFYFDSYIGQSWRRGTKCYCKIDWLWVQSPFEEMKYLFKFIFPFLRSGVEGGVESRHSARNASKIWRKVENGVS